jgi:hypothetical protein
VENQEDIAFGEFQRVFSLFRPESIGQGVALVSTVARASWENGGNGHPYRSRLGDRSCLVALGVGTSDVCCAERRPAQKGAGLNLQSPLKGAADWFAIHWRVPRFHYCKNLYLYR